MDVCQLSTAAPALDVCAWIAISGEARMRLILAVFGAAVILIILWVILWVMATGKKDSNEK